MAKLPKNIIKKYGISKKAWQVFRGARGTTMAKRKSSRGGSRKKGSRRRGGSRGSMMSGWIPLSSQEMLIDFGVGLTVGKVNAMVAPFTDNFLEFAGQYRGEARTALIGAVAYKFGSGMIRDAGREYFRFAVMAAGAQSSSMIFNDTILVSDQYN